MPLGTHLIDLIHFITGCSVTSVNAQLLRSVTEIQGKEVTSDDISNIRIKFTHQQQEVNGLIAISGIVSGFNRKELLIVGEKGTLTFNLNTYATTFYPIENPSQPEVHNSEVVAKDSVPGLTHYNAFSVATVIIADKLAQAITTGDHSCINMLARFDDGVYVQRIVDGCHKSQKEGNSWVSI